MERRREEGGGLPLLLSALIVTALAIWLLWTAAVKENDEPEQELVLVFAQEEGWTDD